MNFSEWREVKLGDIVDLIIDYRGKTPKKLGGDWSDSGYRALSAKNIKTGKLVQEDTIRYVDELLYKKWMKDEINCEDILITSEAPFGEIYYWNTDEKIVLSQRIFGVRINKLNTSKYVYYFMTSNVFQRELYNRATGTTVTGLRQPELLKCQLTLPPLPEQKAIADTLSCLDDKIELNNRINKTLEEMAQAIFKSWFVDFEPFQDGEFEDSELGRIPKGWRVGTLGDIANITMGQSPKGSSYNENNDGTVFYQGRTDFGRRYPTIRLYTTEPKRMADKGDILLSVRAPVGDINVASENCCVGRGLASLKSKNNCNSYVLYQLLDLKGSFNVYNGEGTVFGSINKNTLNNMRVLIPADDIIMEFQNIVGKLDDLYETKFYQIRT